MFCKECGAKLKEGAEFCSNCGRPVREQKAEGTWDEAKAGSQEHGQRAEAAREEAGRKAKRNKKIAMVTVPAVCAVIVFVIVLKIMITPNEKGGPAAAPAEAGQVREQYDGDGGSGDGVEEADFDAVRPVYDNKSAKVGDHVLFGTYEQDNNEFNGKEDIEWIVLDVEEGRMLVVSKYILDWGPFVERGTDDDPDDDQVKWETSTLRKWLNKEFINDAFSTEEQAGILTVTVPADQDPDFPDNNVDQGNTTQDQIFLLSGRELRKYFRIDGADDEYYRNYYRCPREFCMYTEYAGPKGGLSKDITVGWWLRTIAWTGNVRVAGGYGRDWWGYEDLGVRPAMWIDLNTAIVGSTEKTSPDVAPIPHDMEFAEVSPDAAHSIDDMKSVKVGDYVFFGAYEQDDNPSNGKEAIEWLVLEVKDGRMLVISRYILDGYLVQYNDVSGWPAWDSYPLRTWLNHDFLEAAFSAEERAGILTVTVPADRPADRPEDKLYFGADQGNATQDQIFLLSVDEADKYFNSDDARRCKITEYAFMNTILATTEAEGFYDWGLRTRSSYGPSGSFAGYTFVTPDGELIHRDFMHYTYDMVRIRPAMWIDLNHEDDGYQEAGIPQRETEDGPGRPYVEEQDMETPDMPHAEASAQTGQLPGVGAESPQEPTSAEDFIRVSSPDGAYSFMYPRDYFYQGSYDEEDGSYYLMTGDDPTSVEVKFYRIDAPVPGDPYASAERMYENLKGDFLEGAECPYVYRSKGVADDGYSRMIISGPGAEMTDGSWARYYCTSSNGDSTYVMCVDYSPKDQNGTGVENTETGYLLDCLYRGWSLSGSTYEIRSLEQYLNHDMGVKKPGES